MPLSAEPTHLSRLANKLRAKILTLALQGKLSNGNHHWKTVPLGEIADVQLGKMLDKTKNTGKAYPYLANISVQWRHFDLSNLRTTLFTENDVEKFTLKRGDILMCEGGDPGRCAIWQEDNSPIKYQKALHRIRLHKDLPEYLLLVFEALHGHSDFEKRFTGTTIKHLPRERLIKIPIPLPPSLAEQEEIVGKVEALLAEVDHIREAEKIISLCAARLRASILQNALQGHLSNGNHHWIQSTLGEVCNLLSGRDLEPKAYNSQGDGIPYITGASNIDDGKIIINRWTTAPITIAEKGSLLLTCKGTIGKLAFLQEPKAHIARQIMAITSKGDVSLDYIRLAVLVNIYDLQAKAKSFIPGIDRSTVLGLPISYPPSLAEQEEIVGKVEALLAEVDHLTLK
jgi:type I restriction enzyme, S subunit